MASGRLAPDSVPRKITMTAAEARTYLRYSTWASRRLLDAAFALDPEQLHRDLKVSHKSMHGTLEHILFADRIWLSRVLGEPVETPGPLDIELPRIRERWEALANGWTDADIECVVTFQRPDGVTNTLVLRDIIVHVVNHATLHRGQVMGMLRQLDIAPPITDFVFYLREQQATHA